MVKLMLVCEPNPSRYADQKKILDIMTLPCLFVPLQVMPSVYSRKYERNHWWHHWSTWATRGGRSYATTASWQLLRCGKNTQFFHGGACNYAHNTFRRHCSDGGPEQKNHFNPLLGNHFSVWADVLCMCRTNHNPDATECKHCIILNKRDTQITDAFGETVQE